jgi:hypothetical protein
MTAPTHIAAGALIASVVAARTRAWRSGSSARNIIVALAVAVLAVAAHVLMDLMPHFNWVAHGSLFHDVRHGWYYREAVALIPAAALLLILGRRNLLLVSIGIVAGLYPDIEKLAYLAFHVPDALVFFDWHSRAVSSHDAGLAHWSLSLFDMCLFGACVAGVWRTSARRSKSP